MNAAKIRLSAKEMALVINADWILTKNDILIKANQLLGSLLDEQQQIITDHKAALPSDIFQVSPKISKGENYRGLPYLVLDHPRYFNKEDVFAIRNMFWWGNFFSTTLQLSGKFKDQYEEKLIAAFPQLQEAGLSICVNEDEWEHHFEADNYLSMEKISSDECRSLMKQKTFIKIGHKIPIQNWENAVNLLSAKFSLLLNVLVS